MDFLLIRQLLLGAIISILDSTDMSSSCWQSFSLDIVIQDTVTCFCNQEN